jgi:glycosyltransferase involved in cell wall biosynthesis
VEIQVIHNGVDLTSLDPGTIQPGSPPQIVFVGRFMPQKNPLQVIRTLATIKDLSWNCLMIGDGPIRSEVERTIADYGLGERIRLTGWITPDEVIAHYRESDILFMPSLSEGLPVAGVQALAMGLAILASRVGGWVDLVTDESNGYLVAAGEEEKYTTLLRRLLCDPHLLLHFRLESRQKAKQFDLAAIADQYSALYEGIASV